MSDLFLHMLPTNALTFPVVLLIYCLTVWNKFMMKIPFQFTNTTNITYIWRTHPSLFSLKQSFSHPLWRLCLRFDIVAIHPSLIHCYNVYAWSSSSWHVRQFSFCSDHQTTNVVWILRCIACSVMQYNVMAPTYADT